VNANAHGRKTHPGMSEFYSLSFCLHAVALHDIRPAADYALPVTSPAATLAVVPVTANYSYTIYRPLLLRNKK